MNILEDIKQILIDHEDKEHFLKICLSWDGVTVYLEHDPMKTFDERAILPIHYSVLEGLAYIPNAEFKEKYNPDEFGMDLHEISIVKDIMEYFKENTVNISELCYGYDWEDREVKEA